MGLAATQKLIRNVFPNLLNNKSKQIIKKYSAGEKKRPVQAYSSFQQATKFVLFQNIVSIYQAFLRNDFH